MTKSEKDIIISDIDQMELEKGQLLDLSCYFDDLCNNVGMSDRTKSEVYRKIEHRQKLLDKQIASRWKMIK